MSTGDRKLPDPRAADSVLRAIDFVERKLGEPVGVADLAREACYSHFHFSRLFVQATGHSPYDYLMRRRVAVAAQKIVRGERSLTRIAMDCGFESPDTFTRAYRKCFGLVPSEARRTGFLPGRIARTRITRSFIEAMLCASHKTPQRLELKDSFLASSSPGTGTGDEEFEIALRGEMLEASLSFRGIRTGNDVPAYPGLMTRIPGGTFAYFRTCGSGGNTTCDSATVMGREEVLEYAWRVWLPDTCPGYIPPFDITEYRKGQPGALILPLEPGTCVAAS